jgi:hypothetical protein
LLSASTLHPKRKIAKAHLVKSDVRISDKLKGKTWVLKVHLVPVRHVTAMILYPQLYQIVIRSLEKDLCKISNSLLTKEHLKKKT